MDCKIMQIGYNIVIQKTDNQINFIGPYGGASIEMIKDKIVIKKIGEITLEIKEVK